MANKDLNIIIRATDQATQIIKNIAGDLENFAERNRRTFQKMAWFWTAAFAWITAWVMKTTQAAAEAEWTWNKFNTVFAEWADDMTQFINDIRGRMPVATDTIARMGADLQDLLVPMGLARDEAMWLTKQSLELANQIAAFNDVDPSEVLEAMKSWFTGMSQPLKRFGIDASIAALELEAQNMGLIWFNQSLAKLDPAIRRNIQAQALMSKMTKDSADAIAWFEANSDSLIFRQLELKATLEDITWEIWQAFLPIIDELIKSLLPIVETIKEWVVDNQDLVLIITKWGLAITWIVAVLWTLGLALVPIIASMKALGVAIWALFSPIWLLVASTAWLALAIHNDWFWIGTAIENAIAKVIIAFQNFMRQLWELKERWLMIWNELWDWVKIIMWDAVDWVREKFEWLINFVQGAFDRLKSLWDSITWLWSAAQSRMDSIVEVPAQAIARWLWLTWERELWWPVRAWNSYLVWEKWPEIFTPTSSGRINNNVWLWSPTININMWWVVVNNEADEDRLIDKIKKALIRETQLFNNWIS